MVHGGDRKGNAFVALALALALPLALPLAVA